MSSFVSITQISPAFRGTISLWSPDTDETYHGTVVYVYEKEDGNVDVSLSDVTVLNRYEEVTDHEDYYLLEVPSTTTVKVHEG